MSKKHFFLIFFGLTIFLPLIIYSYFLTPSSVQETRINTDIQYQGATEGQYSDYVILSGQLIEQESGNPLLGKTIKFILGTQEVSATTNSQGIAQADIKLSQNSGNYDLLIIFEGDDVYYGSSDTVQFQVKKEDTSISYTGPLSGTEDSTITLSATLSELDDEIGNLSGKSIRFKLGSLQTSATTNSSGTASKNLKLNIAPGTYTLKTEFLGDGYYLPSSTSCSFIVEEKCGGGCGGGGSGGRGCFIATAAYGSPLEQDVVILRKFRDEYLEKTPLGKELIELYYKYSPPIAEKIARNSLLKEATRIGLTPVIQTIKENFFK